MSAYLIARVNVVDMQQYQKYIKAVPGVIERFGGKYIARAGETAVLEGEPDNRRVVIIEFPSLDKAKEFYNSGEYQQIRKLRIGAATGELLAVDGTTV